MERENFVEPLGKLESICTALALSERPIRLVLLAVSDMRGLERYRNFIKTLLQHAERMAIRNILRL
jgi:hypothetical protein